jgi:predicted permease
MRLARVLCWLYPPRLRHEHGAEMEALVAARLERARSRSSMRVAVVVAATLWDVARTWTARGLNDNRNGRGGMGGWAQDMGYALRRLRATPLFTVGAVAIVAVAIGANTAMFALVHAALFERPPYPEIERVVHVYQDSDDGEPSSSSYPAYLDMLATTDVFASVGATSPESANLTVGEGVQSVAIEYTTSTLLPTLGLTPHRGRWFDVSMDQVGAGHFAVVSHAAWERRFGADPGLIGRTIELNGQPVEVIGVGPRDFNGVFGFTVTDFWLSISSTPVGGSFRVANLERRQDHWYDVRARLAEGVTPARAQEAMDALALRLAEAFPELNEGRGITVFPATEIRVHPSEDGNIRAVGGAIMGIVGLVLVLAATNLGSLLLVRGMARGPEIAVRRALGAGQGRVAGLFLAEGLLLSLIGGGLGLLLAGRLVSLMRTMPSPVPGGGTLDVGLDLQVALFAAALMVGTGVFFGWAPALQSLRTDVAGALRDETAVSGNRRAFLFRDGMVAVQVAASVVLVVGASLMVRGLAQYQQIDTGVDVERLALLRTTFSQAGIAPEARQASAAALTERLEAIPGVSSVALTTRIPVSGGGSTTTVVEGYDPQAGTGSVELPFAFVTPGYFETVGIAVVAGRAYRPDDRIGPRQSVIVNETAARRFWGDAEAALGGRVRPQGAPDAWIQVVGVVSDVTVGDLGGPDLPMLYYAMPESVADAPTFVVSADVDPASLLPAMRSALRELNPRLPVDRLDTMRGHLGAALAGPRLATGVLGLFSLLALTLASIGIYTIVSLTVAGRRSEIGLRIALGAERGRVIRLVTGRVLATVAVGFALGAMAVAVVAPRAGAFTLGVEPLDLGALLLATAVLGAVVAIASYVPARRAARVDPVEALTGR